jgi:hypothetical protein
MSGAVTPGRRAAKVGTTVHAKVATAKRLVQGYLIVNSR